MSPILIVVLTFELLLALAGIYLIWSWLNQTPFYPSSANKLIKLISSGEIKVPSEIIFIDIGSGDGRIVSAMSGVTKQAEGIEFNPFLTLLSKTKLLLKRKRNTKIYNKDFFKHDFSKYNVAYLYIFNHQIDMLQDKLFSEMAKGSLVITNTFKFSDREPSKQVGRFYVYIV